MKASVKELTVGNTPLEPFENKFETKKKSISCKSLTLSEEEIAKRKKLSSDIISKDLKRGSRSRRCRNNIKPDRVINSLISPYKMICRLYIRVPGKNPKLGTGFFISPRCIITSGHNVFHKKGRKKGRWASKITVIPGAYATHEPYKSQDAHIFRSVKGYTECLDNNYDYGAIILDDCKLYEQLGVGSYFDYTNYLGRYDQVCNIGYRSWDLVKDTQWTNEGPYKSKSRNGRKVFYKFRTDKGNSGGPILTELPNRDYRVVGIHRGVKSINTYKGCYSKSLLTCTKEAVKVNTRMVRKWNEWTKL